MHDPDFTRKMMRENDITPNPGPHYLEPGDRVRHPHHGNFHTVVDHKVSDHWCFAFFEDVMPVKYSRACGWTFSQIFKG